jgi:hypothetical protein
MYLVPKLLADYQNNEVWASFESRGTFAAFKTPEDAQLLKHLQGAVWGNEAFSSFH